MDNNLRSASADDLPCVLRLIRDLAKYERAPDAVKVDAVILKEDFDRGYYRTIVATSGEEIIAFALYYPIFDYCMGKCMYLEDLYVTPEKRGSGLGTDILSALRRTAIESGCARLSWQVIDWNDSAVAFYRHKLGASICKNMKQYTIALDMLLDKEPEGKGGGTLRLAVPADAAKLLPLLALESVEPSLSAEHLSQAIDEDLCHAILFEVNDTVLGCLLYFFRYSTWTGRCVYVDRISVVAAHRRRGIGTRLFRRMMTIAESERCARLQWQVNKVDAGAIAFFQQFGAEVVDEWWNCTLAKHDL